METSRGSRRRYHSSVTEATALSLDECTTALDTSPPPPVIISQISDVANRKREMTREIPFSALKLGDELGSGTFWTLQKAELVDSESSDVSLSVVVKLLKG